jgi:hypothetical protein
MDRQRPGKKGTRQAETSDDGVSDAEIVSIFAVGGRKSTNDGENEGARRVTDKTRRAETT